MAGRQTARRSRRGRQRAEANENFWHRKARDLEIGRYEFRLTVERGRRLRQLRMDSLVKALSWHEDARTGVTVGSITTHRPHDLQLHVGDRVYAEWSEWGQGRWHGLWRMRLVQPEFQINESQYVFQLEDDLATAARSKMDFKFRQTRSHPNGWRADQAIRHVCKEAGIPVGRIPRMKYRARKLSYRRRSPHGVIYDLLKHERNKSGHRYFARWVNGRLSIVPFQRSKHLLLMGGYLTGGTLIESLKGTFATVLHVSTTRDDGKGRDAKGHQRRRKKRLRTTVESKRGIKRYGRVIKNVDAPHADSIAELRKWGKRELARRGRPKRSLSFQHPGIPTLHIGDALRITVKEAGLDREIIYVSAVDHTVQPGDYSMAVEVSFEDPYKDKSKEKARRKRRAAARRRGRKTRERDNSKPTPKKRGQRSDA